MGQSFWQKLQRVKAKDIGNIFVYCTKEVKYQKKPELKY